MYRGLSDPPAVAVGLFIEASADAEEKISEQQTANCFPVELQPFPLEYTVIAHGRRRTCS